MGYGMISVSLIYILLNWPYTPADAIEDGKHLGAWSILIDIVIMLALIMFVVNKKKRKSESIKYQSNESESVGEV